MNENSNAEQPVMTDQEPLLSEHSHASGPHDVNYGALDEEHQSNQDEQRS